MKTDLPPTPARPPAKRRTLRDRNATPALWLRQWAEDESLPPSQRISAADEIERRRVEDRLNKVEAGILVGVEGATPQQVEAFAEWWGKLGATKVNVPGCGFTRRLRDVIDSARERVTWCRSTDGEELRGVVLHADVLAALPPRVAREGAVWEAVRYARHRKVPVTVILPDGTIKTGGENERA